MATGKIGSPVKFPKILVRDIFKVFFFILRFSINCFMMGDAKAANAREAIESIITCTNEFITSVDV